MVAVSHSSLELVYMYNSGLPEELGRRIKSKSIINTLYSNIKVLMYGNEIENSFNIDIEMVLNSYRDLYKTSYNLKVEFVDSFDKKVHTICRLKSNDIGAEASNERIMELERLTSGILKSTLDGILYTFGYKIK